MAEEANRLKSRFLSTVSHELRTPLSLIVGLSEMVLREQLDHSRSTTRSVGDRRSHAVAAGHSESDQSHGKVHIQRTGSTGCDHGRQRSNCFGQ